MTTPRKVLCVCMAGNSRSVTLAYILKGEGIDAVAIGHQTAGKELKELLYAWADSIICLETHMKNTIPLHYHPKTFVLDVGWDRYFHGFNQELIGICKQFISTNKHITTDPAPVVPVDDRAFGL